MASICLPKILLSVLLLVSISFQVNCMAERYALQFTEEGESVREEIDVDVDNGTEVIRIPGHNKQAQMEVMNDFVAGLTAKRLPLSKECYVSKLDPSLPTPQKLKLDLDLATKQPLSDEKIIQETSTRVLGFADRLALPQRILDFCGSLPIYNIEEVPVEGMNASLLEMEGQGRYKRNDMLKASACDTSTDKGILELCLDLFGHGGIKRKCHIQNSANYYIITCTYDSSVAHTCTYAGYVNKNYCCDFTCHHSVNS